LTPVILSNRALTDLDEAAAYIARDDPEAAHRMIARLQDAAANLGDVPNLGVALPQGGRRVFSVPGTPFRLVYRPAAKNITILRIWYGARGWPPVSS